MPRIADIYSPPYDPVVSGTPIESVEYNGTVADITIDLNTPRPVVAGGTGADSAEEARFNLAAESATQVVTNYDSHMWLPGSFRSATTATGAPVGGHEFAGTCYLNEALAFPPTNQNVIVEARDQDDTTVPGTLYVREKKAGVWNAWVTVEGASVPFPPGGNITADTVLEAIQELDTEKVAKAGDTMTGMLVLPLTAPTLPEHATNKAYVDGNFVSYTVPQTLTSAQQSQARANVYAAPFDAMSYNGMQVNGSMEVSQELGGTGVTVHGSYFCDGWVAGKVSTATYLVEQVSDLVPFPGFQTYARIQITGAGPASPAAGDQVFILHRIEGYRTARLGWGTANAMPITIGFWCKNTRAGIYSVVIRNAAADRTYAATYTQNNADTAEYKVVTIPGDTTGTWGTTSSMGLGILFCLAAGATVTAPAANTWYGVNYVAAPGQVNGVAATTDRLRITGVVILPGIEAPSAERSPLIMRPYDQELVTCQRYYIAINTASQYMACHGLTDSVSASFPLPTEMRASPTVGLPWADGNYNTAIPTTTWCLVKHGVAPATKTGTLLIATHTTNKTLNINMRGATFSLATTSISSGPTAGNISLDARL